MSAFDWGIRFEPVVKQIYVEKYGTTLKELGRLHHPVNPMCTASPDGLVYHCPRGQRTGRLIEIKCPVTREIDGTIQKWQHDKLVGNGTLRRWRDLKPVGDGKPIATGQVGIRSLLQLSNGEIISGGDDGSLRRWRDGKPEGDGKPIATGQGEVTILVQLKNGEVISAGPEATLRRWRDGKPVAGSEPIDTHQEGVYSLIELKNGELISGGLDGSLRRWRDGKSVANSKPIDTEQGVVSSLIELKNGELITGGTDGTLRRWSLAPIARAACRQIDLASIPTDAVLGSVVDVARVTCRKLAVLK